LRVVLVVAAWMTPLPSTSSPKCVMTGVDVCAVQVHVPAAHCPLQMLVPDAHDAEHLPDRQTAVELAPTVLQTLQLGPQAVASFAAAQRPKQRPVADVGDHLPDRQTAVELAPTVLQTLQLGPQAVASFAAAQRPKQRL
jgi:hypothetical protein